MRVDGMTSTDVSRYALSGTPNTLKMLLYKQQGTTTLIKIGTLEEKLAFSHSHHQEEQGLRGGEREHRTSDIDLYFLPNIH